MNKVVVIFLGLISHYAFAFNMEGELIGHQMNWHNAFSSGENRLIASEWSIVTGLDPTTQWIPGNAVASTNSTSIALTSGSDTVNVDLGIVGIEYNTGQANPTSDSLFISSGSACTSSSYSSPIVTIENTTANADCRANFSLSNSARVAPFYFYRPIIEWDNEDLFEAFTNRDSGVYIGVMPITIRYYYKSSGGVATYHQIQETLTVQIDFTASYLTSIEVTGDGVMEPIYDTTNRTVSGDTTFDIKATGYFAEGLSLELASSDPFNLIGNKYKVQIPYSITCEGCTDAVIVSEGSRQLTTTTVETNGGNPQELNFRFKVHYDDMSAQDVESDFYSGSFIVLFEEIL
ncbi:hypothetical protein [Vibrio sp. MA40-2]|uniref:hypothetical protein n=1 Tax=Vibrio sp. MA40-2 TaxID=3391828 RepID=UPI0039A6E013